MQLLFSVRQKKYAYNFLKTYNYNYKNFHYNSATVVRKSDKPQLLRKNAIVD